MIERGREKSKIESKSRISQQPEKGSYFDKVIGANIENTRFLRTVLGQLGSTLEDTMRTLREKDTTWDGRATSAYYKPLTGKEASEDDRQIAALQGEVTGLAYVLRRLGQDELIEKAEQDSKIKEPQKES